MADFVAPAYSKRVIVEAGKALRGYVAYSPEAVELFKIAHNWRASHILPMRHLRMELSAKARKAGGEFITAARLKRMSSIRKKLRSAPHTLYQMQDIGGCRVIFENCEDISALSEIYRDGALHLLRGVDDYIAAPKVDGYRGYHMIFRYRGQGSFVALNTNPLLIELQLRTQMQHVWATAVEAVGMVRKEDLKGGSGHAGWLRLFALMSSEFAEREGTAMVPSTPWSRKERHLELADLNGQLNAVETLQSYNRAIHYTAASGSRFGGTYLVQFDRNSSRVSVTPIAQSATAEAYQNAESRARVNSVLVEVDRVEDLREAYPNYFLDVGVFGDILSGIVNLSAVTQDRDSWLKQAYERFKEFGRG